MLAFVFWHWTDAPRGDYEAGLVGFHRALAQLRVPGFQRSASYRIRGAPWTGQEDAYEDWYLVGGSADLDPLNEAAVSARIRHEHDRPAQMTVGVAGGLYRLHQGDPDLDAVEVSWIAKPRGTPYADFYAGLPPLRALWRRQMVLGPTPEFCAMGPPLEGTLVQRVRIY